MRHFYFFTERRGLRLVGRKPLSRTTMTVSAFTAFDGILVQIRALSFGPSRSCRPIGMGYRELHPNTNP